MFQEIFVNEDLRKTSKPKSFLELKLLMIVPENRTKSFILKNVNRWHHYKSTFS